MPIIDANNITQEYEWHGIENSSEILIALVAGMGALARIGSLKLAILLKNIKY